MVGVLRRNSIKDCHLGFLRLLLKYWNLFEPEADKRFFRLVYLFSAPNNWSDLPDPIPADMEARSTTNRLNKLEADQSLMKKSLEEIAATLTVISKAIEKQQQHVIRATPEGSTGDKSAAMSAVQLPPFSGADPIGWLARANQQFEIHGTGVEKRVALAVVAMEESALYWVTWLRSRKSVLTWEEFSKAIVSRFDTRFKGGPFECLADVKQSGLVEEYINLFVQLAGQVPGLSDEHYLGYFMKGLVDSIRSALRLLRPEDLETAMELARDVEDNLSLQSGGRASNGITSAPIRANSCPKPNSGSGTTRDNGGGSAVGYGATLTPSGASGQNVNPPRFTRLSPQDFADLRAKGLCFRCKKPYTPGHECPLKQLRVLLAEENELLDFSQADFLTSVGSDVPRDPNED